MRQRVTRVIDRVASLLPTVRGRLSALVLVALVPALVILVYDEWLARERGFAALSDVSTRVVRLMHRELDDRITRAAHRLGVLAADPEVVSLSQAATRKLVDAAARRSSLQQRPDRGRRDRRSAGKRCPARSQGQRARISRVRAGAPHPRLCDRGLPPRTGNRPTRSQSRRTCFERRGQAHVRRVDESRPRLGVRIHRTFRSSAEHRHDRSRRQRHRPVPVGGSREVRRKACGMRTPSPSAAPARVPRTRPASTASSACTLRSRWTFAGSQPAVASRSASRWPLIAPP